MKKLMAAMTIPCLISFLTACGTNKLTIESKDKKALVYIYDAETKKETSLKNTPVTIEHDEIKKKAGNSDFGLLKVVKFNHLPTYILIPTAWGISGNINVDLAQIDSKHFKELAQKDYTDNLSNIIFDFLKVQTSLGSKDYPQAKKELDEVEKKYGEISPLHVLKGNYYISVKDYQNALVSYRKAYRQYPKDKNIEKAIRFLENYKQR
jgi:tetratricopeptide (TPR) repeat protein